MIAAKCYSYQGLENPAQWLFNPWTEEPATFPLKHLMTFL